MIVLRLLTSSRAHWAHQQGASPGREGGLQGILGVSRSGQDEAATCQHGGPGSDGDGGGLGHAGLRRGRVTRLTKREMVAGVDQRYMGFHAIDPKCHGLV